MSKSDEEGSHWVAVFVDLVNGKQVCYYNSYGEPCPADILKELKHFVEENNLPYLVNNLPNIVSTNELVQIANTIPEENEELENKEQIEADRNLLPRNKQSIEFQLNENQKQENENQEQENENNAGSGEGIYSHNNINNVPLYDTAIVTGKQIGRAHV